MELIDNLRKQKERNNIIKKINNDESIDIAQLSDEMRDDDYIMNLMIKKNTENFNYASDRIRSKVDLVAKVYCDINYDGTIKIGNQLKNNKELLVLLFEECEIKGHILNIGFFNEELKNDKDFICEIIRLIRPSFCKEYYEYAKENILNNLGESLKNDKMFVIDMIKKFGCTDLDWVSEELKNDKEVVLSVVKNNADFLKDVSDELKSNKEFIFEAAIKSSYPRSNNESYKDADGVALKYANDELRNDKNFVLSIVKRIHDNHYGVEECLRYAGKELKNDNKFVLEVAKEVGSFAIKYASQELQNDKKFISEAVIVSGVDALRYASQELQNDNEFLSEITLLQQENQQQINVEIQKEIDKNQLFQKEQQNRLEHFKIEEQKGEEKQAKINQINKNNNIISQLEQQLEALKKQNATLEQSLSLESDGRSI